MNDNPALTDEELLALKARLTAGTIYDEDVENFAIWLSDNGPDLIDEVIELRRSVREGGIPENGVEQKDAQPEKGGSNRKLDPYYCMVCGKPLEFAFGMVPAVMQDYLAYHCRECKNSICYKCAHTEKCTVCGGTEFDKSPARPPLVEPA